MATDAFELIGATLDDRYRVDAVVGEGGFGIVYRGFHLAFKHAVAIKCLKLPAHFTREAHSVFIEKFREEGAFLSRLSEHPSIVRIYDLSVASTPKVDSLPYLVLEWLEGQELERLLADRRRRREAPFTEAEAITLLRPVVDAIALAHATKIVHRDLKPANVFLAEGKRGPMVKVLDFGIAKAMQEGESVTQLTTKTSSGFSAFSVQYGAPEQFRAKRYGATGPWTDVHALGLILTELVTGQRPIEGEEVADYYEHGTSERRPTPRARGAEVSDAFEEVCAKALALDPRARFATAAELGEALDALGTSSPARPWSSDRVVVSTGGATEEVASQKTVLAEPIPFESAREGGESKPEPETSLPTRRSEENPPPARPSASRYWIGGGFVVAAIASGLYLASGPSVASPPTQSSGSNAAASGALTGSSPQKSATPPPVVSPTTGPTASASIANGCPVTMVRIPAGTFRMGTDEGEPDEKPPHDVTVNAFCLDVTEVTVGAYRACVDNPKLLCSADHLAQTSKDGKSFEEDDHCNFLQPGTDAHPLNCVSWEQARAYCEAQGHRLPTEPEWEYAARGGKEQREYPWVGNALPSGQLCWDGEGNDAGRAKRGGTCPVGSYERGVSKWGALDLAGSVWEWTASKYCTYKETDCVSDRRVYRGGNWSNVNPQDVRTTNRGAAGLEYRRPTIGFRCAADAL